jgi:hypothetical protein
MKRPYSLGMHVGETRVVPASPCTACGTINDRATGMTDNPADDPQAKPGDCCVCWKCGHVMTYDDNLILTDLSHEQVLRVAGDKRMLAIQEVREWMEKRKALQKPGTAK